MQTAEKEPLSQAEINERLKDFPNWKQEDKAIVRVQTFSSYKDALDFVYQVGLAAEGENHHPDISLSFTKAAIRLWTHTAQGVTALDFRLAGTVERLVQQFYHPK